MPKSKRIRPAILSKTGKKGRDNKVKLMSSIRDAVAAYNQCYIVELTNANNDILGRIRTALGGSRIFCGKQTVMAAALGTTDATEIAPHIAIIARALKGHRALICTDVNYDDLERYCDELSQEEQYARAGQTATETVELDSGPLPTEQFAHPMEPHLRKLGLPTKLNAGIIELTEGVVVCNKGDILTPEQCKLLRLLGEKLATFNIAIIARWRSVHGPEFYLDDDNGEEMMDESVRSKPAKRKTQTKVKVSRKAKAPTNKKAKTSETDDNDADDDDTDVKDGRDNDEEEGEMDDDEEAEYDGVPRPMEEHEFDDNGPWGDIPIPVIEKTQIKQKKRGRQH